MADANKLVQRNQFATYMDCGIDSKEDNRLMGDGFTNLVENKNAKEYSRQYVNMATEATDVVGYAPSIAYTADTYSQDPCIKKIMDVTDRELVGTDAQVTITNVNLWEPADGGSGKSFKAKRRKYAIIPDSKGDGTDALVISGKMAAVTDVENGTFDVETKTFTSASV